MFIDITANNIAVGDPNNGDFITITIQVIIIIPKELQQFKRH